MGQDSGKTVGPGGGAYECEGWKKDRELLECVQERLMGGTVTRYEK